MILLGGKILTKTSYNGKTEIEFPLIVEEGSEFYGQKLQLSSDRLCSCKQNHLSCITAKEWLKCQIGVWKFNYEGRDIRDKKVHPATFPISLARRIIELFTHKGEVVLDPFVGSGTTLLAANDMNRNAVGFDLKAEYIEVCKERLVLENLFNNTHQIAVHDDARKRTPIF